MNSQTPTAAACLLTRAISGDRCDVLDAPDLHAGTCECSECTLGARSWGSRPCTTSCPQLNMQRTDAKLFAPCCNVLCCQHRCIRRRLITVSLHFHAARDSGDGLPTGYVGHMDECVIEGCENVSDCENNLTLPN